MMNRQRGWTRLAALALCLGLAGCGAPQQAGIGPASALDAAYAQAGVSADNVSWARVDLNQEQGEKIYKVEFTSGNMEYGCEVNAATGEVAKYEAEETAPPAAPPGDVTPAPAPESAGEAAAPVPAPAPDAGTAAPETAPGAVPTAQEPAYIGEEAAKAGALSHAGVQAEDADYINACVDYDDGRAKCYDVEFWVGTAEYEYEVDLYSGAVLAHEMEHHSHSGHTGGTGTTAVAGDIGSEAALEAALTHAGLTGSQVTEVEISYDVDDGVALYEVEFKCWPNEYEYEISASTGAVLKYEVDD